MTKLQAYKVYIYMGTIGILVTNVVYILRFTSLEVIRKMLLRSFFLMSLWFPIGLFSVAPRSQQSIIFLKIKIRFLMCPTLPENFETVVYKIQI